MPNHPTLKTYEEFLANMAKEDDMLKRRYFELIQRAEKEIARLRAKALRQYYAKKQKRETTEATGASEGEEEGDK